MPFSGPNLKFDRDYLGDLPERTGGPIISRLRSDGHLKEGARIEVAGTLFRVTRARQSGKDADGATPTFPAAYGDVPDIAVGTGEGVTYEPSDGSGNFGSTNRQYQHMTADNPTNQDFGLVAEIQDRGSQTQVTDSYSTGTADTPLTSQGEAWSLADKDETENGGAGLSDTAVDDTYLNTFAVDLSLTDGGSSGDVTFSSLSVTVATDGWDSDDAAWEEKQVSTFLLSAGSGGSDSIQKDQSHEFTDSGLAGATDADDVRTRIKDITEDCGSQGCSNSVSVSPDNVQYDAADTAAESMSKGGESYTWVARQEEN